MNPENPLELNPLQLPPVKGRAKLAPPLIRGGWEWFEPNELFGMKVNITIHFLSHPSLTKPN